MSRKYKYKQIDFESLDEVERRCVNLTRWAVDLYEADPASFSLEAMGRHINPDLDRESAANVGRAALSRTYRLLGRCSCDPDVFRWQITPDAQL